MNDDPRPDATALPRPAWRNLFRGAVRESLAAAYSVARIGTQDTRAWERAVRYVADDNRGNVGVVEFQADGAIAAVSARAPERPFDRPRAIEMAPPRWRDALIRVCDLPLLQWGLGVSTIFWTVGEFIQSPESWHDTLLAGEELFRRELLRDPGWEEEGSAHYGLPADVAHLVMAIADRATVRSPILKLSERELRQLVPKGSEHEAEALDLLMSEGLFEVAAGEQ